MSLVRRNWFYQITRTVFRRGSRFKNGDKPTEQTFKNLTDSSLLRTESEDRARVNNTSLPASQLSGHSVLASDRDVKERISQPSDRSLSVQPSQVTSASASTEKLTVTVQRLAPDYSYSTASSYDNPVIDVSLNDNISTRNDYLIKTKSNFKTFLINFISSFNDIVAKVKSLKAEIISLQSAIATGNDVNSDTSCPVGTTIFHLSPQSLSSEFWAVADGVSEYDKYLTPGVVGSGETVGYQMLSAITDMVTDGSTSFKYIISSFQKKTPYQKSDLSTGFGGQDSWYVPFESSQIPKHKHAVNLSTDEKGSHKHTFSRSGDQNIDTGGTAPLLRQNGTDIPNYDDLYGEDASAGMNESGEHSHSVTGETNFTGTQQSVNLFFNPPQFNGAWVVRIK